MQLVCLLILLMRSNVRLIGVEPAGKGIETGEHGAPAQARHNRHLLRNEIANMQDKDGQIEESYSISAGLDFLCRTATCLFK